MAGQKNQQSRQNKKTSPADKKPAPPCFAACDLGHTTAKFVIVRIPVDHPLEIESLVSVAHQGKPLEAFSDWYREHEVASCAALGATGLHAEELIPPALSGLPVDACLEAALALVPDLPRQLNLVSFGARGCAVLSRREDGQVRFLENEKCSSGTGENLIRIADRFGLTLEEADRQAGLAREEVPITARCSVFAKTEMTHYANQGRPADALLKGFFRNLGVYAAAMLARIRVDGPVVVCGGGARLGSVVRAFAKALEREGQHQVIVPEHFLFLEALGAALLVAETLRTKIYPALPADPAALIQPVGKRFRVLDPVRAWAQRVTRLEPNPVQPGIGRAPCVLGLDLGSTGSKAVLTSVDSGEPLLDVYDQTRGNPVDAARRLLATLIEQVAGLDVRAIGVTGSGRETVATVLRAAYPDLGERLLVQNEIVAHATAAIRCDPDRGKSLSVVEIGGQDAKFIQIVDGQIIESDLNLACSAGTGSFLEEQANLHGVAGIEEFSRQAEQAERPPDLGQMCTVFVAEAAAEALGQGFSIPDLCSGFQYAVIHNYLHRVMGQRTFGKRVFFQGKPATSPSLCWTLAAVARRDVLVPASPGAMGAWGIGLIVLEELGPSRLQQADPIDLTVALAAQVVERSEFRCQDPCCATYCTIQKTTVSVGEEQKVVFSGGACPKYEIAAGPRKKLPVEAACAFAEREALLGRFLSATGPRGKLPAGPLVGIPLVGALTGVMPWLTTFVSELGFEVQVLSPDERSLARGEELCYTYDACAPSKIAHAVLDVDLDCVFFPKILELGDREGVVGKTCAMEQALPEMVREALQARGRRMRVVKSWLNLDVRATSKELRDQAREAARQLGAPTQRVELALKRANEAQRKFDAERAAIGTRTLAYGREHGIPVVLCCGTLHVLHARALNARIPALLRDQGVLALPVDCFPIPRAGRSLPRASWSEFQRALRAALAARARGDVYPLLLTAFSCSPASFLEQVFDGLMEGYPHTVLETNGHGGQAGYATRVQAFLHVVHKHDRRPSPAPSRLLRHLEPLEERPIEQERGSQIVLCSAGDGITTLIAAVYRSYGFNARAAPPASAASFALGRRDCSGKECLPYQLVWGGYQQFLERVAGQGASAPRLLLGQISGQGMCRNCMFSIKDLMSLDRKGLLDRVGIRHIQHERDLGWPFLARLMIGVTAWDLLYQLAAYHRPLEQRPGQTDELYGTFHAELEAAIERSTDSGPRGLMQANGTRNAVRDLLDRASRAFARMRREAAPRDDLRTVLLSGDIYLRVDEFSNDNLIRKLNDLGLKVLFEPSSMVWDYLARERLSEVVGLPVGYLDNTIVKAGVTLIRKDLTGLVRELHPWMPFATAGEIIKAAEPLIDGRPQGETVVTIGTVLHTWGQKLCDGAVIVSPWGCAPALISEGLLRHCTHIPMLFVYQDGLPMDVRKLAGFAFRLRRSPPRGQEPHRA